MRRTGIILATFAVCTTAQAADWYVDGAAEGTHDGSSWANAWTQTAEIAWGSVASNDTIHIAGGDYDAFTLSSGSEIAGVTIQIAQDAVSAAVFSGAATAWDDLDHCTINGWLNSTQMFRITRDTAVTQRSAVVRLRYCQNLTVRGVEVTHDQFYTNNTAAMDGFLVSNTYLPSNDLLLFEDCYVHGVTGDAVHCNTSGPGDGYDRYVFRRMHISKTGDDGFEVSGNFTVEDSVIDHADGGSLFGGHPDGVQSAINNDYVLLQRNRITGYTQNIFIGLSDGHVRVLNNIIYGDGATDGNAAGIVIGPKTTNSISGTIVVAHNTFADLWTYAAGRLNGLPELEGNSPGSVFWRNNLYWNCRYLAFAGAGIVDSSNGYGDAGDVQFYNAGSPISFPAAETRSLQDAVSLGDMGLDQADLYQLSLGDAAVNAGTNMFEFVTQDYWQTTRPRGAGWDIGAHEFGAIRTAPDDPPLRLWLGVPQ